MAQASCTELTLLRKVASQASASFNDRKSTKYVKLQYQIPKRNEAIELLDAPIYRPLDFLIHPVQQSRQQAQRTYCPNIHTLQQEFVTSFTLDLHMKANHKERQSVICSICKVELRDKYSLKKHMSTVHGESKNLCTTCGKKFKAKDYLKKHMLKGKVGN